MHVSFIFETDTWLQWLHSQVLMRLVSNTISGSVIINACPNTYPALSSSPHKNVSYTSGRLAPLTISLMSQPPLSSRSCRSTMVSRSTRPQCTRGVDTLCRTRQRVNGWDSFPTWQGTVAWATGRVRCVPYEIVCPSVFQHVDGKTTPSSENRRDYLFRS